MEIRQLQSLIKLINCNFSVSKAADEMFLVQSAVSQHLKKLEDELGSDLFVRKGKRLIGLTPIGEQVAKHAQTTLASVNSIRAIGYDYINQNEGVLRIGSTHAQARYILPPVVKAFNAAYPRVELQIHQGTPKQLVQWAIGDEIDFSICTEALAESSQLTNIPCYQWNRSLITLPDHPLLAKQTLSLEDLCDYPIITYVYGFTGRRSFSGTFETAHLEPHVVLSAADTDVIKTYVSSGMGVGIIASMALDDENDQGLVSRDMSHLFPWETTRIAYLNDKFLRQYQQKFIDLFLAYVHKSENNKIKNLPV
ncbi:MAG: LysR family cys regulon transcriptional activator [Candidatus Azotimanducaceae bacterium]|jgi:LysR family cys regulon transcriptional activator